MPYLVLDVGTSGCKGAVITERGELLCLARRSYPLIVPAKGQAELDPVVIAERVKETVKELAAACCDIRGVAITSLGESFVLLDQEDRPLYNSLVYLDQRGIQEVDSIQREMDGKRLWQLTGTPLQPMYSLIKYLWLRRNRGQITSKAKKCMLYCDYIGYLLTGERAIDPTLASRTMLFDFKERRWSRELLDTFGITRGFLSEVRETGSPAGKIRGRFAAELGLREGTPLFCGCHDQCSAMLGAGVLNSGDILAGDGSSESLQVLLDRETLDALEPQLFAKGLSVAPFAIKNSFVLTLGQATYGTCIRWFEENLMEASELVYETLEEMAQTGSNGILFFPHMSEHGAGKPGGVFLGLAVSNTRAEMYRAVLEGLCLETKINTDLLTQNGKTLTSVMASGGCSLSPVHMQLKADILKCPLTVTASREAGLTGLAMLCSVGTGDSRDIRDAAEIFVKYGNTYYPQKSFDELEYRYRKWRRKLY